MRIPDRRMTIMKAPQIAEHTSPLSADQAAHFNRLIESLTPTQATWISGYLAGLNASVAEGAIQVPQANAEPAAPPAEAPALTILYGSQTGNAEGVAEQLKTAAEGRGLAVSLVDMVDYKPKNLKSENNLIIVTSTQGEGEPPDNAEELYAFIFGKKAPKLDGVKYSVLGLGDTSYEFFCNIGREFDEQLAKLGGERVHDRVDCDVDYEDAAEAWIAGVVEAFGEQVQSPGESAHPTVTAMPGAQPAPAEDAPTRKNPFAAPVLDNIVLNGRGSPSEVHHIELDVEDSGLVWQPGDSLGVIPENDPQVVDELIGALSLDAGQTVESASGETDVRNALTRDFEITTLTRPFVENYARLAESEQLNKLLAEDNRQALNEYLHGRHVIDVVEDYPVTGLSASEFTGLLRKLPPREYSLASSHTANPDEAHLTVAAVRYSSNGRDRTGVASVQLADRLREDATLPVYVSRNKNFKLPEDNDRPIIMVGPGTGVAPFRAFLEEREELEAGGKNWLFFGAPHFRSDFYYQTDWLRWRKEGLLSRVDVAFSRDQADKIYVQHRLRENARDIYAWLEEGANLYVCGDADYMAHDVHQALTDIVKEQGGLGDAAAADYLKALQKEKRYQRDVY